MKIPCIFALSLGLAFSASGAGICAAKPSPRTMVETSSNPFIRSLRIAIQQRPTMRGQFLDIRAAVEGAFRGRSIAEVAAALAEVQALDAAVRPAVVDVAAISDELGLGHPIALGFNTAQILAITGSDTDLDKDDLILLILKSDRATGDVRVERATIRNTTLYP